jgi:predicted phosphodiesterase
MMVASNRLLSNLAWLLAVMLCCPASADDLIDPIARALRRLEQAPRALPHELALRKPTAEIVLVADVHLGRDDARLRGALRAIRQLAPTLVIFLGDHVSPGSIATHQRFATIVTEELGPIPFRAVRGDNDARDYHWVFGSTHWALSCAGVRVVATGLDIDEEGKGTGRLAESSHRWLSDQLDRARDLPVLMIKHVPIVPPSFLDAPRLATEIGLRPQVRAVLHGHLHLDVDIQVGHTAYLTLAALGPHPRHVFKRLRFYEEGALLEDFAQDGPTWSASGRWRWIDWGSVRPQPTASLLTALELGPDAGCQFTLSAERLDEMTQRLERVEQLLARGRALAQQRR